MSGHGRRKEDYGVSSESSLGSDGEETSARTRPFSFDEIMNRRKLKKLAETDESAEAVALVSGDQLERVNGHGKASSSAVPESSVAEHVKSSSSPKELKTLVKDECRVERRDREIQPASVGRKLMSQINRDVVMPETRSQDDRKTHRGRKDDDQRLRDSVQDRYVDGRRGQYRRADDAGRRQPQKRSFDISGNEPAKKHSGNLVEMKRHGDVSRGRAEKASDITLRSREHDRRSGNVTESEVRKHHSRDYMQRDKHTDENRRKLENRKPQNETQELVKKYDSVKDPSERDGRKELSKSHYRESGFKRRRSRSREHEETNQSSASISLRKEKRDSYHTRDRDGLSSHSKGRSERQHLNDEERNIVNGKHNAASGLGGYSPRKRKSEAAVRTPSPTKRSPEKKSARWDLAPKVNSKTSSVSLPTNNLLSSQQLSSIMRELVNTVPSSLDAGKAISGASPSTLLTNKNTSIDSIQLTQSTRPIRRLYVENVPASASEKAIMDFLSNCLISYGVNHVPGSQPCISCIINKEKGQALVEFLTAEDASAALSFNGSYFSGSSIKIRRPKDYVEVATVEAKKSVAVVQAITDIVKDSPHKIFVGGISSVLSSKMLMEIASAFGPLKGFQLLNNKERDGPHAFLEYADETVTLKACAGLNGMKIGGQVLTAVQAVQDPSVMASNGSPPFHGIPEHAKSLLEKPTEVLKLLNVLQPEVLPSMSSAEIEEVLEDVRLECARFGAVKSINVVKHTAIHSTTLEKSSAHDNKVSAGGGQQDMNGEKIPITETEQPTGSVAAESHMKETPMEDEPMGEELSSMDESRGIAETNKEKASSAASCNDTTSPTASDSGAQEGGDQTAAEKDVETGGSFEAGCVLVEFRRTEASCMAAHCLHGRSFDDRTVTAEYVPLDLYKARFQNQ
ncbi:unnamed protein product [Linum tenue]|uniref:RRM domain-containing protein n=1 Tax=Linum tenue TaxID=586396 RepID=A0AAV0LRQ2_9ROSI|nr:unnamed protein product [Linum tenue]